MTNDELIATAHAWDDAMISNDADRIGAFMAEDWIIVGADGNSSDKASFLALVRSGVLTHHIMTSGEMRVRRYGETAVVLSTGVSAGTYHGTVFHERERASSVFVRHDGRWLCVLTHLSTLPPRDPS